jgi:drug/metabolite transporter (DMT)-like permease
MGERGQGSAPAGKVLAAFVALYIIWGSTYLAILFAIETIPPFLMAGIRFLVAGSILYVWGRARGAARPVRREWVAASVVGGLLLLGGNGAVVWAEQRVPSGAAALLVATVPLWMVVLDWLRPGGVRPTGRVVLGLAVGFAGLGLLVGPSDLGGGSIDVIGALVLVIGSLSWASGSIYARGAKLPSSPLLVNGMEMLAGGVLLVLAGLVTGEASALNLAAVSGRSLAALAYLVVFGSLIGYSAYTYLLGATTPARVSTYAYVNPVVAVFLGWALAGEPLTPRVLVATAVILGAVALITLSRSPGAARTVVERDAGPRRRGRAKRSAERAA